MPRLAPAFVLSALVVGCSDSRPPPGPGRDGDLPADDGATDAPLADADGDGLCNGTERSEGTDPNRPDTDGDGYTDYREVIYAFDPTQPEEPGTDTVHILRENPDSSVQATITQSVRGNGEDFVGAFEAEPVRGTEFDASDFYVGAVAVTANPSGNVALVEDDDQAFRGVVGSTRLVYEVRFAFGDNLPRSCAHAYPFHYNIKRSDGRIVGSPRALLLVLPIGERLETVPWCAPPDTCL